MAAAPGAAADGAPPPTGGRGAFLVFEGADRAGKTTQCELLVDHLRARGLDVEFWRFPDRSTAIGGMINAYLTSQADIDDAAVHLLFSANRWEKRDALLQKLAAGTTLVVDRYAYSGVAFTAAKGVSGLDLAWCKAPDSGLPAPDVVFFLSLTPEQAQARGGYGEERYEKTAFQAAVLELFERLRDPSWHVVDAGRSVDEVQAELLEETDAVLARLAAAQAGGDPAPLRALWDGEAAVGKGAKQPLADL
eukprot:scaffold4.g4742.t1